MDDLEVDRLGEPAGFRKPGGGRATAVVPGEFNVDDDGRAHIDGAGS
jgi:hypothetical protein